MCVVEHRIYAYIISIISLFPLWSFRISIYGQAETAMQDF